MKTMAEQQGERQDFRLSHKAMRLQELTESCGDDLLSY